MELDTAVLSELTDRECRDLLASHSIGRVAVSSSAMPAILPVNYAMLDRDIVFRTSGGSKLRAASERAVVAFEIDGTDPDSPTGWSVVVVGHAETLRLSPEIERARGLGLRSWAPGPLDTFVRIRTERVTGRRIVS